MKNSIAFYFCIFFFLISIPVILPYFHPGYFPTHDGEWAVVRLGDMFRELKDHQVPPRFSGNLNFGYGYPLFNFAYPLPYYIGIVFHFFRFGFTDSIKILFALSVPLSAIAMFFCAKKMWGNTISAFICSLFYMFLPYRFVDLYVRGSIGESLAFVLLPIIFYFVQTSLRNTKINQPIIIAAFFYSLLIMTHNIMAVFFTLLIVLFFIGLVFAKNKKNTFRTMFFIPCGLLLSAFFWIPALLEKKYILLSKIPIADRSLYFVQPLQLLIPKWGYGIPTDPNGFGYQIGLPYVCIFILTLAFIIITIKKHLEKEENTQVLIITGIVVVLLFLMFRISSIFWQLPLLSDINYPWTLLLPIGFLISLLSGYLAKQQSFRYPVLFLSIAAIVSVLPYAHPVSYVSRGDDFYVTNEATTTSSSELMPLWVKEFPSSHPINKVETTQGNADIENVSYNSANIQFNAVTSSKSIIRINTIYFPGWNIFDNKTITPISYDNQKGVMEISLAKGDHIVSAHLSETPLRFISDMISLVSFVIFCLVLLRSTMPILKKHKL